MNFVIEPKQGVGPVKLGMSKGDVRNILLSPFRTCWHHFSKTEMDSFESIGIQIDYNQHAICNIITALDCANPILFGMYPTRMNFTECLQWLKQYDPDIETEAAGAISRKLGISIYTEDAKRDPFGKVECVHVFADGVFGDAKNKDEK